MTKYIATIKGSFDEQDFIEYLKEVFPKHILFNLKMRANDVTVIEFDDIDKMFDNDSNDFARYIAMYQAFNWDFEILVRTDNDDFALWYENGTLKAQFNGVVTVERLWETEKKFFSLTWEKGAQIKHWRSIV